jgi:hypothetical protein
MATTPPLRLNRQQLAQFLKDQEQIRAFENLFGLVEPLAPDTLSDLQVNVGNAQATANQAVSELGGVSSAVDLLTTAPAARNDSSVVTDYIDFATAAPDPAVKVGRLHWNGGYTLNLDMTPNVSQSIGESQYFYIKASGAITKGQLIMFDGSVGASGVLKGKPATGVTNGQLIMGVAAETIANNAFGLVANFGLVRGFNTSGTPYSETWADGDILYYNPSVAGGLTKTLPAAPTPHVVVAAVVNAASGGAGSVFVRVTAEPLVSQLSDVFISGLAGGDVLQYDGVQQRWENVTASSLSSGTATNLAGGAAGSVPYQTAPATTTFLGIGTAAQVLKVNAGATAPEWVSGAALTKVDDTNVTLTLSGTPSASLLAATSLTLGWTGQLAVSRGGTGLSGGTSGGIPYFSSTTAMTSSALLAANALMVGGGAGAAPSTITTGTGVVTALGVNTGTSGAFVVNGGALGTPSSGTVTNLTGTASININGTVGATVPTTGSFTTLTTSSTVTLNGGTANGVAYLNASNVLTTGAALTFDGTNLSTTGTATATKFAPTGNVTAGNGMYLPTANTLAWSTNGSERFRVDSSGNFGISTNNPSGYGGRLNVYSGDIVVADASTASGPSAPRIGSSAQALVFKTDGGGGSATEVLRADGSGNLLLGGTASPASATKSFAIFNGTAPTGSVANGCVLYAEDVSSSSELKVRDEAGNVTTLSPHNFSLIPEGPSEDMAWSYYSERDGKRINIDMLKAIRVLERISGEKLVFEAT